MATLPALGRHSSMHRDLVRALPALLATLPPVKKIILGRCKRLRHRRGVGTWELVGRTEKVARYRVYDDRGLRDVLVYFA